MLEGDVCLGADVRDLGVTTWADQFGMWCSTQNLDHDGLLGGAEGLHRLVMGGFGEVLAIDLKKEAERNKLAVFDMDSVCCVDGEETERKP